MRIGFVNYCRMSREEMTECPVPLSRSHVPVSYTHLTANASVIYMTSPCTTGHTGFGVPHASDPDNCDTPRSAGRGLRYMDRYVTVKQGDVMYITEALAVLEGLRCV